MSGQVFIDVDPRALHLPPSRLQGADPAKLQRQIAKYGRRTDGMPPIQAYQGSDGAIMIQDGVTRATRIAKLLPGHLVTVEIMKTLRQPLGGYPTVGDKLP
jgi:hypothetical protein